MSVWSNLPLDLLANIFWFLSPDSLARARSVCRNWNKCSKDYHIARTTSSWFLALPIRNNRRYPYWYVHNPEIQKWYKVSLPKNIPSIRPIAPIGSLILLRVTNSTTLQLGVCNPLTREFRYLPRLQVGRTNPAVGVTISLDSSPYPPFRVYVAGGMSEAAQGGGKYETSVEMYESGSERWVVVGSTPVELAVRLTVWTPNENVCIKETLNWVTSARAYTVMRYDVGRNRWRELGVPMAERLEFATLVRRNGALALVGATATACIWELHEGDKWCLVDKVPFQLGLRLLGGKTNWESVKCVGNEDAICLYRDLGSGMLLCNMATLEWVWVDAFHGKQLHNCPIRGALLPPTLSSSLHLLN